MRSASAIRQAHCDGPFDNLTVRRAVLLCAVWAAALAAWQPCAAVAAAGPVGRAQELLGQGPSYLDFLDEVQTTPTVSVTVSLTTATTVALPAAVVTSPTLPLLEGMAAALEPTTIPAWLAGPTTGTVGGFPLPLTLENCVQLGLRHNFGLQISERDVAMAHSAYVEAQYKFVPFVNLFSGYSFTDSKTGIREGSGLEQTLVSDLNAGIRLLQNFPTGGDLSISQQIDRPRTWARSRVETVDPDTETIADISRDYVVSQEYKNSVEVTARQPLLRDGGLAVGMADLRLARLAQIKSELDNSILRRDVVLSIVGAYFTALQRQLNARVTLDAIRERKRFYDETVIKHELGEIAESEIWRAKILWLQEQERSRQQEQSFLDSLDALLVLMGLRLETALRLQEFTGRVPNLSELGLGQVEACVQEGLANRPELLLSDISIRRARIAAEVAKNKTLPFLNLEAKYSDSERAIRFEDIPDLDDSRTWSLGALFDLPLPNKAERETLKRVRLGLEQALIQRESQERQIAREVRGLYRALDANRVRIDILAETVSLAERSLQLENARFYYGENTSIDVRNAQDDLFQARSDYNNALLRYQADLASLFKAVGWSLY